MNWLCQVYDGVFVRMRAYPREREGGGGGGGGGRGLIHTDKKTELEKEFTSSTYPKHGFTLPSLSMRVEHLTHFATTTPSALTARDLHLRRFL